MSHSMTQEATNTKRRWGCSCGCLVVLAGVLLAALIMLIISLRSTPVVKREQVIEKHTSVYGEVKLSTKDSGVSEMVRAFIQAKAPEVANLWKDGVTELVMNPQSMVVVDEVAPGEWNAYGVLQPANAATRMVARGILEGIAQRDKKTKIKQVDGAQVLSFNGGRWGAAVGSKLLVFGADTYRLSDLANAKSASGDDMSTTEVAASVISPEMQKTIKQIDAEPPGETEDATVLMSNKPGRVLSLLQWVERETKVAGLARDLSAELGSVGVDVDAIAWLRLSIDIQSADRVVFEFSAPCASVEQATAGGNVLKTWVPRCINEEWQVVAKPESTVRGTRMVVRTTVDGLQKHIAGKVKK